MLVEVRLLHARVGYSTSAQRRATASFAATHLLLPVPQVVLLVEPAALRPRGRRAAAARGEIPPKRRRPPKFRLRRAELAASAGRRRRRFSCVFAYNRVIFACFA